MDKPNGDGTSACSMCQTHTDKFCAGCKKAYYCCVEHQKSHRKIHKKDCFPAVLKYNADFGGRCFTASRNIKQGETIFKDKALLSGPSGAEMFFHFICLGCYRQVKPESTYKCSTCGWPMCSKQCEEMAHHSQFECRIFAANKIQPYFKMPVQYEMVNTLRSLLLMLIDPEKWGQLAELESHSEARAKNPDAVRAVKEHTFFIHSVCNLRGQFDAGVIDHIVGIWGINSFGANYPTAGPNPGRARMATLMFPKLCLAAHSCVPNTRGILLEDVKASNSVCSYTMELIAALPILEGEQIHTTYANVHEGTMERQEILLDNYYFACKCKRCKDPSEFGTFFSAFKCLDCQAGYLLPADPLNRDSKWECVNTTKCKNGKPTTYTELKTKLNKIKRELHSINNGEPSLSTIRELESFLQNQKKKLNVNHWLMMETEFLLAMRILGYLPKCQKSDEEDLLLNRLNELCEHCLYIADLIQPGHISYRGKLLYCLAQAKMKKLVKGTKNGGVEIILQGKDVLDQIQQCSREAMQIISRESEGTEDQIMSQRLAKDLLQVRTMMDFINMKI
ncbi:SET domain-containing protein SmydA-8 [Folsomia candida]|uniref:SET domain-containing protein SmydA-8 n=1 Tax=Folsomia candida TaxID=158441 RepID=UPI001604BAF2|nr:SET domain-containing protein SmydA-8 [Folsomia candida]